MLNRHCNDGSTDNSSEILKSYAQKDNRIIVLEQENQGQSVARNKALDIVKGEYICFVDSDDWVELDFLEELYKAISFSNSELAICSYYYSSDEEEKIALEFTTDIIPLKEYKSKLIKNEISSNVWKYIFKKELFNNLRFIKNKFCEDNFLQNNLLFYLTKDIVTINKPLYHYYQRNNSIMNSNSFKCELNFFEAFNNRYNLDFINKEEKACCLKYMINSFSMMYKCNDYNIEKIDCCKKIINSADKMIFTKAKKNFE